MGQDNLDVIIRSRIAESPAEAETPVELPTIADSSQAAVDVVAAYQNANRWLDTIKETLLMEKGCVFFSNYIHNLAHTMPARFDKFGDILHTMDMSVVYPATEAYKDNSGSTMQDIFSQIFGILDSISYALLSYISLANQECKKAAALSTEELLTDISKEYTNLYRMRRAYLHYADDIKFDKWVAYYLNNIDSLVD